MRLESNLTAPGDGCVISVSGASESLHEGEWTCVTSYVQKFVDRVTVAIDTGVAGRPRANPMKLLCVNIKSEFYKFS